MLFHYFNNLGGLVPLSLYPKLSKLHVLLDFVYTVVYPVSMTGGLMSEATTTRNFRQNLKQFFDLAQSEPVAINRGNERFVLLHESEFNKMKEEIMNLQKSLIATLGGMKSESRKELDDIDSYHEELLDGLEEISESSSKKKAVG